MSSYRNRFGGFRSILTADDVQFIDYLIKKFRQPGDGLFGSNIDNLQDATLDEIANELYWEKSWMDITPISVEIARSNKEGKYGSQSMPWDVYGDDDDFLFEHYGTDDPKSKRPDSGLLSHMEAITGIQSVPSTPRDIDHAKKSTYLENKRDMARIDKIVAKIERAQGLPKGHYEYQGSVHHD